MIGKRNATTEMFGKQPSLQQRSSSAMLSQSINAQTRERREPDSLTFALDIGAMGWAYPRIS